MTKKRQSAPPIDTVVIGPCKETHGADVAEAVGLVSRHLPVTNEQIKHMVDRFLGWRLPEQFSPDAGISFKPEYNVEYNAAQGKPPARHTPTGTNLFSAEQATVMVRYMLDGLPASGEVKHGQ